MPFGSIVNGWNGGEEQKQRWRNVMLQKKCIAIFVFEKWVCFFLERNTCSWSPIHYTLRAVTWSVLVSFMHGKCETKVYTRKLAQFERTTNPSQRDKFMENRIERNRKHFRFAFLFFPPCLLSFSLQSGQFVLCCVCAQGTKVPKWARQSMPKKSRLVTRQSLSHIRNFYLVTFGDCDE